MNSFDPLKHQPPKYNIYGKEVKQNRIPGKEYKNILDSNTNIINPWEHLEKENQVKTRAELISKRKQDNIPDKSYDIDGDGYVGGRDYVLSKRFDIDKDGKLNKNEKEMAIKAIHENIEDEYVWNLENQTLNRPTRIMQKRGKIIDQDNFLPLKDTYPDYPVGNSPKFSTFTELKDKRKLDNRIDIDSKIEQWEKHNPKQISKEYRQEFTHQPRFSSKSMMKENKVQEERVKAGLDRNPNDTKVVDKNPSLVYIENPKYKTKGDISNALHKENQELSKKILSKRHINEVERLNIREEEIYNIGYSSMNRKTLTKIKEERRKENLDYNMKVFSNQTIGVHGHELPKFSNDEKYREFWKYREDWIENPKHVSRVELLEDQKFWKKKEELKVKDYKEGYDYEEEKEKEGMKKEFVPKTKENELIIKINHINHFKDYDPNNPVMIEDESKRKKHIYRWTSLVNQFKIKNGSNINLNIEKEEGNTFTNKTENKGNQVKDNTSSQFNYEKRQENLVKNGNVKEKIVDVQMNVKENLYGKYSQKDVVWKDKQVSIIYSYDYIII